MFVEQIDKPWLHTSIGVRLLRQEALATQSIGGTVGLGSRIVAQLDDHIRNCGQGFRAAAAEGSLMMQSATNCCFLPWSEGSTYSRCCSKLSGYWAGDVSLPAPTLYVGYRNQDSFAPFAGYSIWDHLGTLRRTHCAFCRILHPKPVNGQSKHLCRTLSHLSYDSLWRTRSRLLLTFYPGSLPQEF
jgi:hypothetical protein